MNNKYELLEEIYIDYNVWVGKYVNMRNENGDFPLRYFSAKK